MFLDALEYRYQDLDNVFGIYGKSMKNDNLTDLKWRYDFINRFFGFLMSNCTQKTYSYVHILKIKDKSCF